VPIYVYKCAPCDREWRALVPYGDRDAVKCSCRRGAVLQMSSPTGRLGRLCKDGAEYQPGMARFPGDPNAMVTSRRDREKKIDNLKRDGYQVKPVGDCSGESRLPTKPINLMRIAAREKRKLAAQGLE